MKNQKIKINRGFTLIESLVAIGILSLSILATFTAVQGGLQGSVTAKDQITAFYLAQEAMEYIKNVRDENALNSVSGNTRNWLYGLASQASEPCYFGKTCIIDSAHPAPQPAVSNPLPCSGSFNSCENLRQDPVSGLYGYTPTWALTSFKREIQFTSISSSEVRVTIRVGWTTRGQAKSFQVSQLLYDRQ